MVLQGNVFRRVYGNIGVSVCLSLHCCFVSALVKLLTFCNPLQRLNDARQHHAHRTMSEHLQQVNDLLKYEGHMQGTTKSCLGVLSTNFTLTVAKLSLIHRRTVKPSIAPSSTEHFPCALPKYQSPMFTEFVWYCIDRKATVNGNQFQLFPDFVLLMCVVTRVRKTGWLLSGY